MARVYVSGSIQDQPYVQNIIARLQLAGHEITHDWTAYKGRKDNCDEAERQREGVRKADVLVLKVHPRLKAGWMEFGAACMLRIPIIVIPHSEVSDSMWYALPNVHMIGEFQIEAAVRKVVG